MTTDEKRFYINTQDPDDVQRGKNHVKNIVTKMDPTLLAFALPALKSEYTPLGISEDEWQEWLKLATNNF